MALLTDILKQRISKSGVSKAHVADLLGVTERTIENYINGNREPKPAVLVKLSQILGFELSELSEQNVPRDTVPARNEEQKRPPKGDYLPEYIQSILEQKRILEEQNQFLRRNFEISLSSIAEAQQVGVAHLKALAWYSATVQAGENEQETNRELMKINTRVGEYLLATVKKKYSGRTYNDHLIVLRTFFNCFVERDWIQKNPFRAVKKKTQTVGRNLAYTDQERKLLSDHLQMHDRRLWYFTQIMFHCFIRRTELTTIRVKHIDLVNSTIIIPGETAKNNTQESVVIPDNFLPVLQEMQLHRYGPEDFVFGRKLETGPVQYKNPNWISSRHNDIVKALRIDPEKGLYSWKHTGVGCYYYATGKDVYALLRQLRHRDLKTTMIYLKSLGLIQNDTFRLSTVA